MTAWTDRIGGAAVRVVVKPQASTTWIEINCDDLWGAVTVHWGRNREGEQPESATCTFTVRDTNGAMAQTVQLRRQIRVELSDNFCAKFPQAGVFAARRFAGWITDTQLEPHPAGGSLITVTGTSMLAEMQRTYIGDEPWPEEHASTRMVRIITLAGQANPGYPMGYFDPWVIGRDVDRRAAGELLSEHARDGRMLLYEDFGFLTNSTQWQPTEPLVKISPEQIRDDFRRDYLSDPSSVNPTVMALDACDVLMASTWAQTTAGVVNEISLTYGPQPQTGERPSMKVTDAASQNAYGRLPTSVTLNIRDAADATTWSQQMLNHTATPFWQMSSLQFDLAMLTDMQIVSWVLQMLGGTRGTYLFEIQNVDPALPLNIEGWLWLEGFTETIGPDGWLIDASVTDALPGMWGTPWNNVDPALQWDKVHYALQWDQVDQWTPETPGSWDAKPLGQSWDATTGTWDTVPITSEVMADG